MTAVLAFGACIVMTSVPAGATEHGWPQTPNVSCDEIAIDPASWIKVTFTGSINDEPFTISAMYNNDGSHNAHIDVTSLTSKKHSVHIVVTASSNFGFGPVTSETANVTLDCSTVTQGSTTPSSTPTHIVDSTGAGKGGATNVDPATQASAGGLLPFTGGEVGHLALIGGAMLATGLVATRAPRRRRRNRRPSRGVSNYD